jgi:hypothetical protein
LIFLDFCAICFLWDKHFAWGTIVEKFKNIILCFVIFINLHQFSLAQNFEDADAFLSRQEHRVKFLQEMGHFLQKHLK